MALVTVLDAVDDAVLTETLFAVDETEVALPPEPGPVVVVDTEVLGPVLFALLALVAPPVDPVPWV